MISVEHVGRTYPSTNTYQVSAAKIAEFARAIGETGPQYFSKDPVAPVTFAALIAAQSWEGLFADPELGLSLSRTIHADQRFQVSRLLRAGDQVVADLTIDRVRNRGPAQE